MLRPHRTSLFSIIAILWLLTPTSTPAQQAESLAILDLEGRGISAVEAASLTDRLRNALVRTGGVTVVERGQMEQILGEQDFQLTGCTSNECAVDVGQLLGVTSMVAGSIGKVGSTFSIDIRTVDVQSGRITHSLWRDYRGEIDGLLGIMPEIAAELVSAIMAAEPPPTEAPAPASIAIITQPPGATIILDGQDAGTTPFDSAELEPDSSHAVSINLDGYQPVDTTIFAETGQSYELNLSLKRLMSQLTITSTPPGAVVFMDGRRLSPTPLSLSDVVPDRQHWVSLRLYGYQQADTTFFARASEHHRLNIALQPVRTAFATPPAAEPKPEAPQQGPQKTMMPMKRGRGMLWMGLAAIVVGGGSYYIYTYGLPWGQPPGDGLRVGNPPSVPSQ
ncbi:MAG: PEGA domain-containing protein [Calditrichaeota bacterium]|nr:PEGA domain-containing protein [Calditrichota bacterium]